MIEARGITRTFAARRGMLGRGGVRALRGIDVTVPDRGAVSFIGESGCGKTTLGRILCGLEDFDGGDLVIDGQSMSALKPKERAPHYRRIQLIHQDPYTALNPTRTISQILTDPLRLRAGQTGAGGTWVTERRARLLELVGLDPDYVLPRYPHMLSGGMRQRVVIARALTVDPHLLVADEAVSMIDVSLRLGILQLLRDLRTQLGVAVVFITHDVATARYVGHGGELYVLYRGTVVERGPADALIAGPVHPYTQSLLSAVPVLRGLELPAAERVTPRGPLDEQLEAPGCLFEPRCPFAEPGCRDQPPPLLQLDDGAPPDQPHAHACLHPSRRSVVPVPAVTGNSADAPERSGLPAGRQAEPGPQRLPSPGREGGVELTAQGADACRVAAEVDGVRQQDRPRASGRVEREAGAGEAGVRYRAARPGAAQDVVAVALADPAEAAAAVEPGGLEALGFAAQPRGHRDVVLPRPPGRERLQVGGRREQAGVPGDAAHEPGVLVVHDAGPGDAAGRSLGRGEAVPRCVTSGAGLAPGRAARGGRNRTGLGRAGRAVARPGHPERAGDEVADCGVEGLARDAGDDLPEGHEPQVGVGHPGTRPCLKGRGVQVTEQFFGACAPLVEPAGVGQAGGVREQLPDRDLAERTERRQVASGPVVEP